MDSGPYIELVTVPRADDMHVFLDVAVTLTALNFVEHFIDPVDDFALANRSTHMGANALPGIKFVAEAEYADFHVLVDHDLAVAVGDLVGLRYIDFPH
jgi:mannose/fructose/N-acetylgalactosamine-specific phosphotransferase system component IIB